MPKISQIDEVPCQAEVRILQTITLKMLYVSNTNKSTIKRVFNISLASAVRDMKPFKLEK